jgi:hypothetical protein
MNEPTPSGWIGGLSSDRYHQGPEVSASFLRTLIRHSPAHARAEQQDPRPDTPALRFGSAVHACILEPGAFWNRYAVAPKADRRTREGKATWEAFTADHPGAEILTESEGELLDAIAATVEAHPLAPLLLRGGEVEVSGYWSDPETGVSCRCRPDYLRTIEGLMVDLKTTLDGSPIAFQRAIHGLGYHVQASH